MTNEPTPVDRLAALERRLELLHDVVDKLAKKNWPQFVTVAECAEMLRVSERTVYDWISTRSIPHHKAGHKVIFMISEVIDWTREQAGRGRLKAV